MFKWAKFLFTHYPLSLTWLSDGLRTSDELELSDDLGKTDELGATDSMEPRN
jgi:hypothetical protein